MKESYQYILNRGVSVNKEFVKKMIKAEMLRYEAIKEILPESLKKKVDSLERDTFSFVKEIAFELIKEKVNEQEKDIKKETKKVDVDFS